MFRLKLRQRFWKMFDAWASPDKSPRKHGPTVKPRLEVLEDRVVPTTYWVDTLSDSAGGQGFTNEGDLRYCMNNAISGDTIYFGVSGTISLQSELPVIWQQNLTITDQTGQGVDIWGGNMDRIFHVIGGARAEIDNLSIDDGYTGGTGGGLYNEGTLTLRGDTFLNNQAVQGGGAIYNASGATLDMLGVSLNSNSTNGDGGGILNSGDLLCIDCTIVQNKTIDPGGNGGPPNFQSCDGGGLANIGGTVALARGQVGGNSASDVGGGIFQSGGTMTISASTRTAGIQANSSQMGGGLFVLKGSVTIAGAVSISNNRASTSAPGGDGGGICLVSGSMAINTGVSISNNFATTWGGGLYVTGIGALTIHDGSIKKNDTSGSGGGIFSSARQLNIKDEKIDGNTAGNNGGGLYVSQGVVFVTGNSITGNQASTNGGGIYVHAGSLNLTDVGVSGNTADSNGAGMYIQLGGAIVKGGAFTGNIAGNNGGAIYNSGGILTLSNNATIGGNNIAAQGGGLYLAIGSLTTFSGCTVNGNQANTGVGVYQQTNAQGKTAQVKYAGARLTDNDDPGGKPVQGP